MQKNLTGNKVATVWSQEGCSACRDAVALLELRGYVVEERKIGAGKWSKQDLINVVPNARSVPQIFIRDKFIGSYNLLRDYLDDRI